MRYEGPVSAHRVSRDSLALSVHGKEVFNETGELLGDVVVHFVMLGPFFSCRVDIKTSSGTKVVRIVLKRVW